MASPMLIDQQLVQTRPTTDLQKRKSHRPAWRTAQMKNLPTYRGQIRDQLVKVKPSGQVVREQIKEGGTLSIKLKSDCKREKEKRALNSSMKQPARRQEQLDANFNGDKLERWLRHAQLAGWCAVVFLGALAAAGRRKRFYDLVPRVTGPTDWDDFPMMTTEHEAFGCAEEMRTKSALEQRNSNPILEHQAPIGSAPDATSPIHSSSEKENNEDTSALAIVHYTQARADTIEAEDTT
ncbi:hypothetical protein F511_21142 [Dorcoceras hygrometricum]|uniref:Uncharacterized protein n=1 Tax=Dorcoceras hygrometricum TaxID=472368 RepID=A0A2Z7CMZ9_9LAMI|nr:hypothetical protein F511_21142 [Dorcoceras hygrometricum]